MLLARVSSWISCLVLAAALPQSAPARAAATEPMIFYLARGEADACGPGCREWIAAEGEFDANAVRRFRDFLDSLNGRSRPVFFNSLGGIIGQARMIGRILRERRMTAGVGETFPEGCHAKSAAHETCRRIAQSNRELSARLRTSNAICHSACVYALIGSSFRQIPHDASVGIHASVPPPPPIGSAPKSGTPTREQVLSDRRRYVLEMGVDPKLVDASQEVPRRKLRILSRRELVQFGIELQGIYETDWVLFVQRETKRPFALKATTQSRDADRKEYGTTRVRMACADPPPGIELEYRPEPILDERNAAPLVVRIALGDGVQMLKGERGGAGTARYSVVLDPELAKRFASAGNLTFGETLASPDGSPWSREIKVSTHGLAPLLEAILKDCGER